MNDQKVEVKIGIAVLTGGTVQDITEGTQRGNVTTRENKARIDHLRLTYITPSQNSRTRKLKKLPFAQGRRNTPQAQLNC